MREGLGLTFPTLVDPGAATIVRYGILNEKAGKLPHPTAYVVDSEGVIRYKRTDVQYTKRPSCEELLQALAALKEAE